MDLENELTRLLHTRDVPLEVADPVTAVHAGMRRRRRGQRLQVLAAGVGVLALAVGATLTVSRHGGTAQQLPPATETAVVPLGFQAVDVTFVDDVHGFVLGSAPCASGYCTALLATDDGGQSYVSRTPPPAGLTQLRFAPDDLTGYAYGLGLALTTDGGRTWTNQQVSGAVLALDVVRDGVLRAVAPEPACPCSDVAVERSAVGGSTWTSVLSSTGGPAVSAAVLHLGDRVAVLSRGHTSGGAQGQQSHLWLSKDSGTTWSSHEDPCGPPDPEVDTIQLALAPEGVVTALCQVRSGGPTSVVVSNDSGRTYSHNRALPAPYVGSLLAAPGSAFVVAVDEPGSVRRRLLRSTDQGRTWEAVTRLNGSSAGSLLLTFSSEKVGTWVGADRRRLERTTDGGLTWKDLPFR